MPDLHRFALVPPDRNVVWEILELPHEIGNPGNVWHDVTDQPMVTVGWLYENGTFEPPVTPAPPGPEPLPEEPTEPTR